MVTMIKPTLNVQGFTIWCKNEDRQNSGIRCEKGRLAAIHRTFGTVFPINEVKSELQVPTLITIMEVQG